MVDKEFIYKEHLLFLACLLMSDEPSDFGKKVLVVYDTKDNDRLVGVFNTAKSCAKILNSTSGSIQSVMTRKKIYNSRYRIERLVLDDED